MPDSDANKLVLDVDSIPDDGSPTIGQVMDAARRIEQGLEVSAAEREAVARFNEVATKTMSAVAASNAENLARIGSAIGSVFQGVNSKFGQLLSGVQAIGAAFAPVLAQLGAAVRDLPPRLEAAVAAMAGTSMETTAFTS